MSLGLPFERWVGRLAALAQEERDPQRFLALGVQHMLTMPWVRGVEWRTPQAEGDFGVRTAHATQLESGELKLVIHTRWTVSPAILLHLKLLAQMVGHFYEAKQRAQVQRQNAYTQAIYETGARLTHDVKNLLQSLKALCAAAANTTPEQAAALQALMQRQLPQITQRLNTTLDKLRSPEVRSEDLPVRASAWWNEIGRRMAGGDVALEADITADGNIPVALFDTFVENAVANARAKGLREPGVTIKVEFRFTAERVELDVTDTGSAVSPAAQAKLFREPVERGSGLGIGLYHVARLALQTGYRVELVTNRDGEVRMRLSHEAEAKPALSAAGQG
jgi:signal transduction histidine kinase